MADFLGQFSCLLDVGTAANAARTFNIDTALIADNPRGDPFLFSLSPDYGPARMWLRDRGSADQQLAITFVRTCVKAFGLCGRWEAQWASTDSDPVIDGFSGGITEVATREARYVICAVGCDAYRTATSHCPFTRLTPIERWNGR